MITPGNNTEKREKRQANLLLSNVVTSGEKRDRGINIGCHSLDEFSVIQLDLFDWFYLEKIEPKFNFIQMLRVKQMRNY